MTTHYKVVGSNPGAVYWVDIFHIDFLLKLYWCLFEKAKNKRKRGRVCPFKKCCIYCTVMCNHLKLHLWQHYLLGVLHRVLDDIFAELVQLPFLRWLTPWKVTAELFINLNVRSTELTFPAIFMAHRSSLLLLMPDIIRMISCAINLLANYGTISPLGFLNEHTIVIRYWHKERTSYLKSYLANIRFVSLSVLLGPKVFN